MSPSKSDYMKRLRDHRRMRWIKEQSCAVSLDLAVLELAGPCEGVIEADHAGGGSGMGRKAPDDTCIPACVRHHRSPGLDHLLYGHVEHGFVRQWKKEQAATWKLAYDIQHGGGR